MTTPYLRLLLLFVLLVTGRIGLSAENGHDLANLERSFWLHASLATKSQKGYWGPAFPASPSPMETDIRNAAKLVDQIESIGSIVVGQHQDGLTLPLRPQNGAIAPFMPSRRHRTAQKSGETNGDVTSSLKRSGLVEESLAGKTYTCGIIAPA